MILNDKELDQMIARLEVELDALRRIRAARRGEEYRPKPVFAGMRPILAIQKYLHATTKPAPVKQLVNDLIDGGCSYGKVRPRKNITQSITFNIKDGKLTLNGKMRKGEDLEYSPDDLIGLPEWLMGKHARPDSDF